MQQQTTGHSLPMAPSASIQFLPQQAHWLRCWLGQPACSPHALLTMQPLRPGGWLGRVDWRQDGFPRVQTTPSMHDLTVRVL